MRLLDSELPGRLERLSVREGYEAVLRGAVLASRAPAELLLVRGRDAKRFLHGYATADLRSAAPGAVLRGYFLELKGHVLADAELAVASEEEVLVRLPEGRGSTIRAHLERYVVADRVAFEGPAALLRLAFEGPGAADCWEPLTRRGSGEGPGVQSLASGLWAVRFGRSGRAHRELWGLADSSWAQSLEPLAELAPGIGIVSEPALSELLRIERGELAFGIDYGEEAFPQELGESEAVSFTKGCYLGQEVVARIHYRGGVQRQARGLRFSTEPPERDTPLFHDGREAGRVGSVADSPRFGWIGLTILHQRVGEPPARVSLPGGEPVEVVALPFEEGSKG